MRAACEKLGISPNGENIPVMESVRESLGLPRQFKKCVSRRPFPEEAMAQLIAKREREGGDLRPCSKGGLLATLGCSTGTSNKCKIKALKAGRPASCWREFKGQP